MLRLHRFLPGAIVVAVLIAIAWTIGRSGVVTQQWSSTGAPQASRAPDTPNKDGKPAAGPDESVRPNAATAESTQAPPVPGSDNEVYYEINSKLAAVERRLNELTTIEKKLNDLANSISIIRQTLGGQRAAPSAWSRLEFWVPTLLGLLMLSAAVALSISIRSRKPRPNEVETRPPPHFEEAALNNATELLLSKFRDQSDRADQIEQTIARLQATVQGLVAEIRKLPAGVSNQAAVVEPVPAPFKPSATARDGPPLRSRSPAPPKFEDQAAAVLADFNEMAANDGTSPAFQQRWRPQSVVMANFEQRVRESGFTPQLFVRSASIGNNDEHFWFIPFASSQGYILPAKRLLQHRSALRGDGAAKLFRMIFEIIPAESFSVERPAHGQLDGSNVRVLQQGAIRLPQ